MLGKFGGNRFDSLIEKYCTQYSLSFNLIKAIIKTESDFREKAIRFEKDYRWFYSVKECAGIVGCTKAEMEIMQKTSWGLMQIMGAVYYERMASRPKEMAKADILFTPEINIEFGCWIVRGIIDRKKTAIPDQVYDAYNSGRICPTDGNQKNVERFMEHYKNICEKIKLP
jgi:soluble lytic murein transglycosylase-like protein